MEIKISNGIVYLKEDYTRKIEKEYKKIMYGDFSMKQEMVGAKGNDVISKTSGIKLSNQEEAQDYIVKAMIEKIEIDGVVNETITQDTIDNLLNDDYNKIVKAIDKITKQNEDEKND